MLTPIIVAIIMLCSLSVGFRLIANGCKIRFNSKAKYYFTDKVK